VICVNEASTLVADGANPNSGLIYGMKQVQSN
jgi:hypothetical protein